MKIKLDKQDSQKIREAFRSELRARRGLRLPGWRSFDFSDCSDADPKKAALKVAFAKRWDHLAPVWGRRIPNG